MTRLNALTSRVCPPTPGRAADLGLLTLRVAAGGLLAGHGAQKLFGALGGHGLEGTAGWLESIGLRPGKPWAALAGLSELAGGALTALGFLHPLGPITLQGSMATAARKVHWGKPIWVTEGGAELPAVYATTGLALGLTGPGRYSLDRRLGITVPKAVAGLALAAVAAGVVMADRQPMPAQDEPAAEEAVTETPDGGEDRLVDVQPSEEAIAADEAMPADQPPAGFVGPETAQEQEATDETS